MARGPKGGTSPRKGGAKKGGKQQRVRWAERAEAFAAASGTMMRRPKAGRARPQRTEVGGGTKTRRVGADTVKASAKQITTARGKGRGEGRKRLNADRTRPVLKRSPRDRASA